MQGLPSGSMLAVPLDRAELQAHLTSAISIAAENGPALTVVSGTDEAINELEARLRSDGVACHRLRTSHAFHSSMMEPIVKPFLEAVAASHPMPPKLPYVSNVTGTWIRADEATSPEFWARHLRAPVKFWSGFSTLIGNGSGGIFIEAGPGSTLTAMLRGAINGNQKISLLTSLRRPGEAKDDCEYISRTLARLWVAGVASTGIRCLSDKYATGLRCRLIPSSGSATGSSRASRRANAAPVRPPPQPMVCFTFSTGPVAANGSNHRRPRNQDRKTGV